jgi:glycosyltransferase involved in cell wall biosynthesis
MRIGIDARLIQESGVGRYIRNLIRELSVIDTTNRYIVFLTQEGFDSFQIPNDRWAKRLADVRWHSLKEQLVMPMLFMREHLDVLHVPYFNAPLFYPGKYLLTIHDLTIRYTNTGLASTYPKVFYWFRRLGYSIVLALGMKRARHIITVSHTVQNDIIKEFLRPSHSISVTYEGVDPELQRRKKAASRIDGPYFLYIGNAYPHKNIPMLLSGYGRYVARVKHPLKLVLVGKRDYFYHRLAFEIGNMNLTNHVQLFGQADDNTLHTLYAHARALVFSSRMEGFGLPGLEALVSGCPVICSDIPIFHELLGDIPTYVDTNSVTDICAALMLFHNPMEARKPTQTQKLSLLMKYNWRNMAVSTLSLYESIHIS